LTYQRLKIIGINTIRIDKIDEENFRVNFVSFGSFEEYILEFE
jgi:hypothetical protein